MRKNGIERGELIAFGDNYNDLTMLAFAGLAVVMENSHEGLRERGYMIAPSNDDDGVAQILEQLMEKGEI
jgi:hypothetical protein